MAGLPVLYKALKPSLEILGTHFATETEVALLPRRIELLKRTERLLAEAGVTNPQQIPMKMLVPIVRDAVLEETDEMTERWAALLASTANPNSNVSVMASFPHILSELSPKEAAFLDAVYGIFLVSKEQKPDRVGDKWRTVDIDFRGTLKENGITLTEEEIRCACDNLERLNLLKPSRTWEKLPIIEKVRLTDLGYAFVAACMSPKTKGNKRAIKMTTGPV